MVLLTRDNLAALAEEHWRAIALDQDTVPLAVDWHAYLDRERAGSWRAFTARRDGELVGYIGFHMHRPDRYRQTMFVQEDTIWVVPVEGASRGLIWRALWREAIKAIDLERLAAPNAITVKLQGKIRLSKHDASVISSTLGKRMKSRAIFMVAGLILKSLGMRPIEVIFSTVLK
jgi:hypothetical protein